MPIIIPASLPAHRLLKAEGVPILETERALRQQIRPLRVAVLNLMPEKIKTETQLARLLGQTPIQIELTLVALATYAPKTVSSAHMKTFYRPWPEVRHQRFDGFIITGAPVEQLPFSQVAYWEELCDIIEWTQSMVTACLSICWGAQAALRHFYGVPKHALPTKRFGVYAHRLEQPTHFLLRGINDNFRVPVSRHTETRQQDLAALPHLQVLSSSPEAGLCLVEDPERRYVYMFNHLEYDSDSLAQEYFRDKDKNKPVRLPAHYFPEDDPTRAPVNNWRASAHLLFRNWLDWVYLTTPFEIDQIGLRQDPGQDDETASPPLGKTARA